MNSVTNLLVRDIGLCDHSLVTFNLAERIQRTSVATAVFRSWKHLDIDRFRKEIVSSSVYTSPEDTVNSYTHQLQTDICRILDELLPIHKITRRTGKSSNQWLSVEAVAAKQRRRQLERRWKATGYEAVRVEYRRACKVANQLINESRRQH